MRKQTGTKYKIKHYPIEGDIPISDVIKSHKEVEEFSDFAKKEMERLLKKHRKAMEGCDFKYCKYCGKLLVKKKFRCIGSKRGWLWETSLQLTRRQYCNRTHAAKHQMLIRDKKESVSKRNLRIIEKALLPNETLDSVGKVYGITRERVRQILKRNFKIPYRATKALLMNAGKRKGLRCLICGKVMPILRIKKGSRYCSNKCRRVFEKYDFSEKLICQNCGGKFYSFRSYHLIKRKGVKRKYCSFQCYIKKMSLSRIWTQKLKNELKNA